MSRREEAEEILDKMKDLMSDLDMLFRREGGLTYDRYRMYPGAHIKMALSKDHDYLGGSTFTVQELIDDLDDEFDDDGDD